MPKSICVPSPKSISCSCLRRVMGQLPAKVTAKKKWAFSERKARESRNLYLLLGFGSAAAAFAAAAFAAAATALGAAAPFLRVAGGARSVFFKTRRLPVDRSRIPAPRSPGKSTRRMCAYGSSSHSASPSSSSLLYSPGSSSVRWSGGHLFFFLLQSSHRRFFGPRFIAQVLRLCARGEDWRPGARRWKGGAEAGASGRVGRRAAAEKRGAPPWRPPCPAGAPLEKNGRFRWAEGGCWGLQMAHGVEKTPLETMGA